MYTSLRKSCGSDDIPQADNQQFNRVQSQFHESMIVSIDEIITRYYPNTLFVIDNFDSESLVEPLLINLRVI